ncbi:MAG: cellobiose phosphorylase, partial [Blautia massiliensis]|nr:cellobiose phosphorylase [Blautia massiliensis (ex Durand et al. 2017)]
TVMYANALYGRGFAKEGWKAIKTLTDAAMNFDKSRIYPGIPEYFSSDGRGMYNYLTGAASWLMMTVVQEMYGVKGLSGDLVITPRLTAEQFDADGTASISLPFAGSRIYVTIDNPAKKEAGKYQITGASLNGAEIAHDKDSVSIERVQIENKYKVQEIRITLG